MNESRRQQIFYSVVDKDDLFIDTENFFWKTQKTLLAYNAVITILLFWRIDVLIFK